MDNVLNFLKKKRDDVVKNLNDNEGIVQRGKLQPKLIQNNIQQKVQPVVNKAVSNFQGNIRNIRQDGWKNIQTAANPNKAQFFNQSLNAPGTTLPDVQKTLINRYGAPVLQIPYNIKQTFKKDSSLMDRASGALGAFSGVMAAAVDPTDLYFYGADALKGYNASRIKGGNFKQNLQSAKQGLTGEKYFGLGDATTTNAGVGNVLNMAELPLLLAGGYAKAKIKGMGGKTAVKGTRQTIDQQTLNEVDGYRDYLNRAIKGERVNEQEFNQVLNGIDSIVEKWLPKKDIDSIVLKSRGKATPIFYRNLMDAVAKKVGDYSEQYQGFRMGIKDQNAAKVKVFTTKQDIQQLMDLGYKKADIDKMKPQQVQEILSKNTGAQQNFTPLSQVDPESKMKLGKLGYNLQEIESMPPDQRKLILDKNAPKTGYDVFNQKPVTEQDFNKINKEAESYLREQYNLKTPKQYSKFQESQVKAQERANIKNLNQAQSSFDEKYNLMTPKQYSNQQVSQRNYQQKANMKLDKQAQPSFEEEYGLFSNEGKGDIEVPPEIIKEAQNWKDKGKLMLNRETPIRNIEEVAGKSAPAVKKFFFNKVQENEQAASNWIAQTKKTIQDNVINKLGIKPNSQEDRLTMMFGEGRISLEDLKKQTPKWQQVVEADKYFRSFYDDTLKRINDVITKFGYDPVPKRKNYYTHYQELGDVFDKLGTIMKGDELPRDINGLTVDFKPGKEFFKFAQPRLGGEFKESAIGAVDTYLVPASRQIFHTDSIQRGRALQKVVGDALRNNQNVDPKFLTNFFSWLDDYNNTLSGKKTLMARGSEGLLGRNIYSAVNLIKGQTAANQIGGNVSSALTNFIPAFTQAPATMDKGSYVKGLIKAVTNQLDETNNYTIDGVQSSFLRRRFQPEKLAPTKLETARASLNTMFEAVDKFTSNAVVVGKYLEGVKKGLNPQQAMKRADDYAARMMGDRSFGQTPQIFQNQGLVGLLTQYQLEVNNQLSFLFKDIPRNTPNKLQLANRVGQVLLYSYLFNNAFEMATGRRPAFDPIGVAVQSYQDYTNPDVEKSKANMNLVNRISDQLPFTSTLTGGGRIPLSAGIPDVMGMIQGTKNPASELMKPISYFAMPGGGGQAKKTIEGIMSYVKGYSETPSGKIKFPIKQNIPNAARSYLFGQYSTPEAVKYYREGQSSLSDEQSQKFKMMTPAQAQMYYQTKKQEQELNSQKRQIKEQAQKQGNITQQGMIDNPFESDTKAKVKLVNYDVPERGQTTQSIQQAGIFDNPLKNLFGKKEPQQIDPEIALEQSKLNVELSGEPEVSGNTAVYKDGDSVKTIDFGKVLDMPNSSKADKAKRANEAYKTIDDVMQSGLTDSQKSQIIDSLELEKEDVRYYLNAKEPLEVKFGLMQDRLSRGYNSRDQFINDLESWRRPVNGEIFADDSLIDELFYNGDITEEERKALKDIDYNKITGKLVEKSGKGRKVSLGSTPAYKSPKISFQSSPINIDTPTPSLRLAPIMQQQSRPLNLRSGRNLVSLNFQTKQPSKKMQFNGA